MIEWLRYVIEWMYYVFRADHDVRLGQYVDRVMWPSRGKAKPRMARRYIALMSDREHQQRHKETLIRAGY